MTTTTSASPDRHREAALVRQVANRLRSQFPELSAEQIDAAVNGRYAELEEAPIREFIPVLVERGAVRRLAGSRYRPVRRP